MHLSIDSELISLKPGFHIVAVSLWQSLRAVTNLKLPSMIIWKLSFNFAKPPTTLNDSQHPSTIVNNWVVGLELLSVAAILNDSK